MRINNYDQINFKAIYKIPNANLEEYNKTCEILEPICENMLGEDICIFYGDNPNSEALPRVVNTVRASEGTSYDWFRQNAANHGIKVLDLNDMDIWVLTGDDVNIVDNFYKKAKKARPKNKFLKKLNIIKINRENSDLPSHLRMFLSTIKSEEKHNKIFSNLVKGKEIIKAKNFEDVFMKLIGEDLYDEN